MTEHELTTDSARLRHAGREHVRREGVHSICLATHLMVERRIMDEYAYLMVVRGAAEQICRNGE